MVSLVCWIVAVGKLLASERGERDGVTNGNRRYMGYVPDNLVARAWCYIRLEELSVKPFL